VSDLARRGFLRGLTTLPLIGGGVTLIANPTRAAEPINDQLLDTYEKCLFFERHTLYRERFPDGSAAALRPDDRWRDGVLRCAGSCAVRSGEPSCNCAQRGRAATGGRASYEQARRPT
jgi:hypothetical protein